MTLLGATPNNGGTNFALRAPDADAVWLCLFDAADRETRLQMVRDGDVWHVDALGVGAGARYGYRVAGPWQPEAGLFHDPAKLLVDPYAVELDRAFVYDPRLSQFGEDTAALVPRAIVPSPSLRGAKRRGYPDGALLDAGLLRSARNDEEGVQFPPGGLIYEINVRGFSMLHPDVPPAQRGTVSALAHPAIIAHLRKIGVQAIELMPITAWIDERHLPPLGLRNAWGYNPVVPMALDPRLCPGGVEELRATIAALHDAGIAVILDLVFNHNGESDIHGPILSFRGCDNAQSFAHAPDGRLINDTGCGNTFDFARAHIHDLTLASLRHFARLGVDGFRFDLAPIMARSPGFDPQAPIFAAIADDPLLSTKLMIAEPWDIGPGGYQLGQFPPDWLEWNDRYRDDVRRFWRGEGRLGDLATRLCGSADIFGGATRSVNFLAAHDGFTLADSVAYEQRHNHANGENNRDGHGENFSWNNGVEGPSDDPAVVAARDRDKRALLATLFASRGAIMLTAGDEFGRSQHGNNNAYAQDNAISWIDWQGRDTKLEDYVAALAAIRASHPVIGDPALLADDPGQAMWLRLDGAPMQVADWEDPDCAGFVLELPAVRIRVDRAARAFVIAAG